MKNANEIINDPIKSTLFGKFYERIILEWLKEEKGFTRFEGKPRIYWKDVELINGDSKSAHRLNEVLKRYKNEKQFCTPDGLLEKNGKFYIWEAKNWPLYNEGKKPLSQLEDLVFSMPLIQAKKAVYRSKKYNIDEFYFLGGQDQKI